MAALLALSVAGLWAFALAAWPDLPERVPTHWGTGGRPDAWDEPGFESWFLLPTLATALAAFFGGLLPRWVVGLARRNSKMLNMPQRARFRALPDDARVRAAGVMGRGLRRLSLCLLAVFGFFLFAANEVAHGRWDALPEGWMFALVGVAVAQALWLVVAASRAVTREAEAAAAG